MRWRLFRAAGELRDKRCGSILDSVSIQNLKAGCSLVLVPPPRTEPPPDLVNRNIFLTKYLRIHGTIPLDTFARCHFTQELYRMTWGWEPRCSYEVEPDDENPFPLYGNWATPDGQCFFCEWYDDCPPCEDSIRGPCLPGGGSWYEAGCRRLRPGSPRCR